MTWKILAKDPDPGTAYVHGGDSTDKINKLLSGVSINEPVGPIVELWTFSPSTLRFQTPTTNKTFNITTPDISDNYNLALPTIIANDELTTANNTQVMKNKTLTDPSNIINIPDTNFQINSKIIFSAGGLTAVRTYIFPNQSDTIATIGASQTFTSKSIDVATNTLFSTGGVLGDVLKYNGTKYVRLPIGSANFALMVNNGGTDAAWVNIATLTQTLQNKDLTNVNNTFRQWDTPDLVQFSVDATILADGSVGNSKIIANAINDSKILAHTSTKITILNKALLNANIVYADQVNTWGDFNQDFRSGRLRVANPTNSVHYAIVGGGITGDVNISFPVVNSPDTFVQLNAIQTLKNKDLTDSSNTLPVIIGGGGGGQIGPNTVTNAEIATQTTTKITTTNKSLLNSAIVYNDQPNTYGSTDQLFKSGNLKIRNPANTFSGAIALGATTADRTYTIPSIGADGTFSLIEGAQTISGVKTYLDQTFLLRNPANTVSMKIVVDPTIAVGRTFTLPALGGDGTFACLEGTQTITGLKTFSAQTTHNIAHVSGTETLATFKVDDDTTGSALIISNSSGQDTHFGPTLNAKYLGSLTTLSALNTTAQIDPGSDSGTSPVVTLTAKNSDSTNLVNRAIFQVNNNVSALFTINPSTIDLHNIPLKSVKLNNSTGANKVTLTVNMASTTDRTLTIPSISGDGTIAFLEGGQTFSGTKTFTAQTNYTVTAVTGSTETLAQYKVSDDTVSTLKITNSVGQDGHFAPGIAANYLGSLITANALNITAQIDPGSDSGAAAVTVLTCKNSDNTLLMNRSLWQINNNTTPVFSVDHDGINFRNQPVKNLSFIGLQGTNITGHQYGGILPDETSPGEGLLQNMTVLNPGGINITVQPADAFRTWGLLLTCPGATQQVGFYKNRAIAYPDRNPRIRILPYISFPNQDNRFYCGWTDFGDSALLESDTPLDGITAGILLGFRTTDTNWMVFHSDGEGTGMQVYDTGVLKTKTSVLRDFELKSVIASNKWTINPIHVVTGDTATANTPLDITTSIPLTLQPLYFHCSFQVKFSDTARQMYIFGLEIEVGTQYGGQPS